MSRLRTFWIDESGASAAEFALVLPLALLMLFGIIDVGMYAWALNEYEKATQMGARFAVVTDVISPAVRDQSYVGVNCDGVALSAGDRICATALGNVTCNRSGCTCNAQNGTCPTGSLSPTDSSDYDALVARMRQFQPRIPDNAVTVEYQGSGLGFAGDPNKPEIAPLVTVRVRNVSFSPMTFLLFGGTVPLPDFSYSLTMEDGEGGQSG